MAKAHVHQPWGSPASVRRSGLAPGQFYSHHLSHYSSVPELKPRYCGREARYLHCALPDVWPTEAECTLYYSWGSLLRSIRIYNGAIQWLYLRRIWSHLLPCGTSLPTSSMIIFGFSLCILYLLSSTPIQLTHRTKPSLRETNPLPFLHHFGEPPILSPIINSIWKTFLFFFDNFNVFWSYSFSSPSSFQIVPCLSIHLTSCSFLFLNTAKTRTKLKWSPFCVC